MMLLFDALIQHTTVIYDRLLFSCVTRDTWWDNITV